MKTKIYNDPIHSGKTVESKPGTEAKVDDPLAIEGWDYVEIFAGNARQAAYYYATAFGFKPVAYRGPETGYRDTATYVLQQGTATLLLSSPLTIRNERANFNVLHGDSARDVAFRVPNCEAFYHEALKRGAESHQAPTIYEDDNGVIKRAAIKCYGDNIHSIVERTNYKGNFFPGFVPYNKFFPELPQINDVGILSIDHVVANVELGAMDEWVSYYENVLGFAQYQHFSDDDVATEYSALMSKVMANGTEKIKLPINEPAEGKRKSQIEEYLDFHHGPGVQHIAMQTEDIIKTITALRARGITFLYVPDTYYEDLQARVGTIDENVKKIAELGILVDRDDEGYLLQLFTKPLQDRPTLFFELIQRKGSRGFGIGNFQALFESIEREQALRGNL